MYAEVPASLAVGYHVVCIQGQSGGVYSQLGCGTVQTIDSNANVGYYTDPPCRMTTVLPTVSLQNLGAGPGVPDYFATVQTGAAKWDASSSKFTFTAGSSKPRAKVETVYLLGSSWVGQTIENCGGLFGIGVSASSKHLKMNHAQLQSYPTGGQIITAVHELGHVLGLGHYTTGTYQGGCPYSVMDPVNCPSSQVSMYPTSIDVSTAEGYYP